jgi:CHAD domain-containing protein
MTAAPPRKAQPVDVRQSMQTVAALRACLREALAHVQANAPGAAQGVDPEYLHQMRVGTRRLRAALRASKGLWRKDDGRALRRGLRKLAAATGPARDWDVQYRRLGTSLRARAGVRRRSAHAALRRALPALSGWKVPRAIDGSPPALPDYACDALERLDARARRRATRIDWSDAQARHALRIRLRRLRYAAEFMRGAFPRVDASELIAALEELQDVLGELNDVDVGRRLRAELAAPAVRPRTRTRERRLVSRLPAAWRRFATAPRFWRKIRR